MKSTELVQSLSEFEAKAFKKYLASPYFNCSSVVSKLFNFTIENKKFEKPVAFKKLYPGKKYDDKQMRYVISDLNKHLEKFFVLRQLEKDPLQEKSIKAKALSNKSCYKAYSLAHREIVLHDDFKNADYYLKQYEHAEWHINYINKQSTRKTTPDYTETLQQLDTFYFAKKLQLACEVTNLANILKKEYNIPLLNEIKKVSLNYPFGDIAIIKIYSHILETLLNPSDETHFAEAGRLLRKDGQEIHPGELSEMYQYIRNFCVRKINQGNTEYVRKLFNIYNDMLNNKSLMRHDYLSQWEFKNIVTISLRLEETKWCDNFIKKYINHLEPSERKNALAYNTAYYYFMMHEYHKAIKKLQEVELTDVFYQLDARVIILKSYYELDEYDAFFYHSSAFRLFLLRNRGISDYQKSIYRNLIKFLGAIVRAYGSKTKLARIKSEIEKEKNVADLNYLLKLFE